MTCKTIALTASVVALMGLPAPAWAEWSLVGQSPNGDRYHVFEESITQVAAGIVVFDTLVGFAQPRNDGSVASIDRFVADCRTGSVTNVSWTSFDADQQIVDFQALPRLEANIAPNGTLMASEIAFACQAVSE